MNLAAKEISDGITRKINVRTPGCRLESPSGNLWNGKAIFEAIIDLKKDKIKSAFVEIMIPLVSTEEELKILRALVIY